MSWQRSETGSIKGETPLFWARVVSAFVFAALVILVVQDGLWLYFITVSVFVILSGIEFFNLAGTKGGLIFRVINIFSAWLVCLSSFKPNWIDVNIVLCLAIGLPAIFEIIRREPRSAMLNVTSALFGIFYIGWLSGRHLILLRKMSGGRELVFFLLGIAWSSDISAYLIGSRFGKHKIIPAISPGKSLEGFISGIAFSVIFAVMWRHWLLADISFLHVMVLSAGLAIVGQIGDLAESLLKRSANVKDSGKLIPGHGGILDRCDSMMFIAPALYYYSVNVLHLS